MNHIIILLSIFDDVYSVCNPRNSDSDAVVIYRITGMSEQNDSNGIENGLLY